MIVPHVCGDCRTVLDWYTPLNSAEPAQWRHSAANLPADGHAPRPVPQEEMIRITGRCDICSALNPTWQYAIMDRAAIVIEDAEDVQVIGDSDGWWAACRECAPLIDARKYGALVRRAYATLRAAAVEAGAPIDAEIELGMRAALYLRYTAMWNAPTLKTPIGNNEEGAGS